MKILVTGAFGQLGREIEELSEKYPDWQFIFTDVDTLDITNEISVQSFFEINNPDYIINCAAFTSVDKAETEVVLAELINSVAVKILAIASKNSQTKFIHISTDYVFDGNGTEPYLEDDFVNPQGVYGKTKLAGELNCLKENPDSIIIRTSWLYSSFGNNFVKTILRLGKERNELNVVNDQVGTPTYAADLALVILSIIEKSENNPEKFQAGIFHYSNEGVTSWYNFAKEIFEISGIDCKVNPVKSEEYPTPAKRPKYSVLNINKIKKVYNLSIPNWNDSLKVCLNKIEKE